MREQTDDVCIKISCQHGVFGPGDFIFGVAFVVVRCFGPCQHGDLDVCSWDTCEQTDNACFTISCQHGVFGLGVFVFGAAFVVVSCF